jgi:Zn-finger nucleic acid-binding protein
MARPCPRCEHESLRPLRVSDVEVETCPRCHGLWLEQGKLDALLERHVQAKLAGARPAAGAPLACSDCGVALQLASAFVYEGDVYCARCRPPGAVQRTRP